ncbi:allantoinase-like [Cicer arietinum]|uniref:allantoinase-like n=1 Tax=Cicer arietinum TaxID=3827 RepID=UPI003CC6D3B0
MNEHEEKLQNIQRLLIVELQVRKITKGVEINEGKIVSIVEGYVVDRPPNNNPTTMSKETLELKLEATENKIYVDVFWGGMILENALNTSILEGLLIIGVLCAMSFMCPLGIDDFPMTTIDHIKEGLFVLTKYRRSLIVHAEIQHDSKSHLELYSNEDSIIGGPLDGAHVHIVHLSDSSAF